MQVSYNWLKEYVTFDLSPEELAHKLTMAGIAVDAVEYPGKGIENVVVGAVEEITAHPNADRLVVCKVNVGEETIQIVTGAPNVRENVKVAVALAGARLPNGLKIKEAKLRGKVSAGMVCSAQELALDPKHFPEDQRDGIIIFPDDVPVGEDIKKVLGLDDHILVLDLTPNRADCMSVVNVAREVAAVTGGEFKLPDFQVQEAPVEPARQWAEVEIKEEDLCHRYVARIITDVNIGPSPMWMQQRLRAAGVRSINNVVDVTNYIMLELGQPMHAFDYEKLAGHKVIVRRAAAGEKIVTLDEDEHELDTDMLVIADVRRPVAVAGVMGGLDSEVTENTKTILLESAYFQGTSVRRTSRKLGLRSESSNRFEKGIDKEKAAAAADRAAQLLAAVSGGRVAPGAIDVYPKPWQQPVITLRCQRVNHLLGTKMSCREMKQMLEGLFLQVDGKEEQVLQVKVPSYRSDLNAEIDLVEEVVRLYGYGNIETAMPAGRLAGETSTLEQTLRNSATRVLLGCGLNEVISYSFISPGAMDRLQLPPDHEWRQNIAIQNPLSEEQSVMRTTLLPGLLDTAAKNFKRRQTDLALFEVGKVFYPTGRALPEERTHIGAIVSGQIVRGWVAKPETMDFFYLKGIVEELLRQLAVGNYSFEPFAEDEQHPSLHPGRSAVITCKSADTPDGEIIGYIGEVHPGVLDKMGLQQRAAVTEIDLPKLEKFARMVPAYRPLPKFPAVVRDMAVVIPEQFPVADINVVIKEAGGNLLKAVYLFDVYKGRQIPDGYRSLAYSMKYQADNRTLTDEEVTALHEKIQAVLREKFNAQLRL